MPHPATPMIIVSFHWFGAVHCPECQVCPHGTHKRRLRAGGWLTGVGGFAPCFPVRGIETALAHYEQLGFDVMPYTAETGWA